MKRILPMPELSEAEIQHFWNRVDRSGGSDACWPWVGSRTPNGYGRAHYRRKQYATSRLALFLARGIDAGERLACHTCDNPPCCNPAHLFVGTNSENVQDCISKGRYWVPSGDLHYSQRIPDRVARGDKHGSKTRPDRVVKGEAIHGSRLTAEKVQAIRSAYAAGGETYDTLASKYGVSPITIFDAIKRKTWKHVE